MALYDTYEQDQQDMNDASLYLSLARQIYSNGKRMQALKARYAAGTSPIFNAAVNDLHAGAERTDLNQMGVSLATLLSDWEQNHALAVGFVP